MNAILTILARFIWVSLILILSSCALLDTIDERIPGFDRIFHRNSTAEVGPIKTESGDVIASSVSDAQAIEKTNSEQVANARPTAIDQSATSSNSPTKTVIKTPSKLATIAKSKRIPQKKSVKHKVNMKRTDYVLSGKVSLIASQGPISPEGVIVRLNRVDGAALQSASEDKLHLMDMKDKVYQPGQLIIRKGDTVNFFNSDEIKHNVFSSTGDNAFDLGTFGGGLQRAVRLNEEGVAKVYCNIHPKMATFVAIDDTGISKAVKPGNGFFEFINLPSGDYEITLWSVRGEQKQVVTLGALKKVNLDITFDTSVYEPPVRINKYGEKYKKKSLKREYY